MKYNRYFNRVIEEFIRDLSAFGNALILIFVLILFLEGKQLIISIIGIIIVSLTVNIIKLFFYKERPVHIEHSNILEKMNSGSFPSLHSAQIMYLGSIAINTINSIFIDTLFVLLIIGVGYSRYHLKKHYIKDIMGGYAIGFLVFLLILYLT